MAQDGQGKSVTRVKPRLLQVLQDIVERGETNPHFLRDISPGSLVTRAIPLSINAITATTLAARTALKFDELTELGDPLGGFHRLAIPVRRQHLQ